MLCSAVQIYTNEYARFLFRLPSSLKFLPSSRMHVCMHAWLGFSGGGAAAVIDVVFVIMEREEFKKKKKGKGEG